MIKKSSHRSSMIYYRQDALEEVEAVQLKENDGQKSVQHIKGQLVPVPTVSRGTWGPCCEPRCPELSSPGCRVRRTESPEESPRHFLGASRAGRAETFTQLSRGVWHALTQNHKGRGVPRGSHHAHLGPPQWPKGWWTLLLRQFLWRLDIKTNLNGEVTLGK